MAAAMNLNNRAGRRRVFVLVDKGKAQGVFNSWEAAEAYADENRFSLENLMEYETRPDHPDHLHLMAAKWDDSWEFVGEWTRKKPSWNKPPQQIRLDHYHARGPEFRLLRQNEFHWKEGLLEKVNPMAPDSAMVPEESTKAATPPPQWKPKLAPLKPVAKPSPPPPEPPQGPEPSKTPEEPEPSETGSAPAPIPPVEKIKPRLSTTPPLIDPLEESESGEPQAPEKPAPAKSEKKEVPPLSEKSKIAFQKRNRLRLKSDKLSPKPIPVFDTRNTHGEASTPGKSTVELAHMEQVKTPTPEEAVEPRKVIPLRLILPIAAIIVCWGLGIFYVFRPEPTAQKMLPEITTLARADVLIIEPGQVFFQLPVDPVNQHRWVQTLELNPVSAEETLAIPTMHTLRTWEKPEGFIRPPYAAVEVREWWDLRLRPITYGFYHQWEDGSILILDLESDLLIGWAHIKRLPDLLN